ncbi:MAG: FAD-dependent monooxygenase [Granulosicoccus sp.]
MQYHINDYVIGDPAVQPPLDNVELNVKKLPNLCDVLIVGCGPAGLTAAAQLAAFPEINTCIIEQKSGPLKQGQADGVACRTMEMFQAFGFAHKVTREACWVNETTFWRTSEDPAKGIYRSGRVQDTEDGLSEFPHTILNQARVHHHYLDLMRNSPHRSSPFYNRTLNSLSINDASEYPVTALIDHKDEHGNLNRETVKAKYLIGGDGARSRVRAELGLELLGDSSSQAWGVMDVLAVTDFPDVRCKSIINAAGGGSVVLIPREGGFLFRIYVEMDKLTEGERVRSREFDSQDVIDAANKVLHPFPLDVRHVAWWSVYEIGQRMTTRFDNLSDSKNNTTTPRIFIAGDACHTHSPKAGQGMNVSMQDAFNLGWKLAAVLRKVAPATLLHTYSEERHAVAKELIDFDREWAELLHEASKDNSKVSAEEVQSYFVRSGQYTAGTATCYSPSLLTGTNQNQSVASGLEIGKRFHSAELVRLADAKPMQLGHVIEADGRFRLFVFAPLGSGVEDSIKALAGVCSYLENDSDSPVGRFTPTNSELDSLIDVRAILPYHFRDIDLTALPQFLFPRKGKYQLRDYEKVFCFGGKNVDIYTARGIDKTQGCLVIVRPDQYIAHVLPLHATDQLTTYFERVFIVPGKDGD